MKQLIGVFDSGVGGMTTKAAIEQLIPQAEILYYGDTDHCPYGDRSPDELVEITSQIVNNFTRQGAKIVVIACNTATTRCIHALRARFPEVTFVGTEPAIKAACDDQCANMLLMATTNTVKSRQVQNLIEQWGAGRQITTLACPGLADLVESSVAIDHERVILRDPELVQPKLENLLKRVSSPRRIDGVILGCTHYVYLKSQIQAYFPDAKLYDGNSGVARRVRELLLSASS